MMIRNMQEADVNRVAEIYTFSWRHTYRGIFSDEFLFNTLSVVERAKTIPLNLESFVYDDGIIKGLLVVGPCRDEDKPEDFEIFVIYLDPFFLREGIGTKLMDYGEGIARERGYSSIRLWVLEENTPARTFYEKMGYAPDGTRKQMKSIATWELRYVKEL